MDASLYPAPQDIGIAGFAPALIKAEHRVALESVIRFFTDIEVFEEFLLASEDCLERLLRQALSEVPRARKECEFDSAGNEEIEMPVLST